MRRYRLSAAAQADIVDILARTEERFGRVARIRYETLIVTAIRDIAEDPERPGAPVRPELGIGARSWHFRLSRDRASGRSGPVRRPRHLIVFRIGKGGIIEIGRVLHDAMELERHRPASGDWD